MVVGSPQYAPPDADEKGDSRPTRAERARSTCGSRHALRDNEGLTEGWRRKSLPLIGEGAMKKFFRYLLLRMERFSILESDWPLYEGC
jgi:hypothetical protein